MNVISPVETFAEMRSDKRSLIDRVRVLLPEITERADEIERGRTIPLDLIEKLQETGVFRMMLPSEFGGDEPSLPEISQVIEEIAYADASVAWTVVISGGLHGFTAGLPFKTLEKFYSENGRDVFAKAVAAPGGAAIPVEGGYRLTGRWPFASGPRPFNWVVLGFTVKDGNGIRRFPDGRPDMRAALIPASEIEMLETWDAVGLRGTRSDDILCKDVFVPEDWQGQLFGESNLKGGSYKIPSQFKAAGSHGAIVRGLLRGAIDDIANSALTRRPAFNPSTLVKDDPTFQTRFGELAAKVDTVASIADMCLSMSQVCVDEVRGVTPVEGAKIGACTSLLHHEATSIMDQLMLLSGSAGLYAKNRIQRRWRDLRCLAQHQGANISAYVDYSKSLTAHAAAMAEAAVQRAA